MNTQNVSSPVSLCVACLNPGRQLNFVNDQETKHFFNYLLGTIDTSICAILICYECMGRLKGFLRFRKQVQQANQLLSSCTKHNPPTPMTTLEITKTETFEWKPDPALSETDRYSSIYNKEIFLKRNSPWESDDETSDNTDTLNFNCDNLSSDVETKQLHALRTRNNREFVTHVSRINETWEIKIENVIEKTENTDDLKEESNNIKCKDIKDDVVEPLTKYEFSDSDDEPLKVKKARKKKVKREGKEQTRERPAGVVSGVWVQKKLQQLNVSAGQLEMVVLSWEEVELERQKSLTHTTYTRHEFRCPSCVVGFNHRFKLDSHMKKHLPEAGELECSICQTRFKTQAALLCHRRRHRSRWRCTACLSLFSRAAVAADHVARAHGAPPPTHACHVCGDKAASLGKLRVHLKSHAERQHCEQCGKTFRDKSSLRTHLYIHTNQMDFSCEVCDKKFRFKKALEIHSITHQASELLYCADCDMNFKNRLSFYQHINYSMKHIHPDKIKYACEFCPRRFSKPARLQEHRLSIHLKLAPHRCAVDSCTFASASRPALRTHTRMVHRNKRLERNHVCHTCGKAYTTKKILEGHIRSHTGERPFICAKCPATFSHDAALYNHNKLVHKTPFVRRQKPATLPDEASNWVVDVVNTGKSTETVTDP